MAGRLPPLETFRQRLRDLGYREGENVRFEERFAEGQEQRYPALAADLVASQADLILTWGTPATLAAKRATSTIPIVMAAIGDPVGIGAVSSLARPGRNITGLSTFNAEIEGKRLKNPEGARPWLSAHRRADECDQRVCDRRRSAAASGLSVEEAAVRDSNDLDDQLQVLAQARPQAVVVVADSFLNAHHPRITRAMAENRLPAIYGYHEAAVAGGLMAYSPDYHELFRRAAGYVDKIIRGAKPGDLPIEQPTRFALVLNLKAAQALGLCSAPFVARADEVIE